MADTFTTNYSFTRPEIGASRDTWGIKLNANLTTLDTTIKAVSDVANAAVPKAGGTMTGALNLGSNALTAGATTITTLTASGNATIGGTLGITGAATGSSLALSGALAAGATTITGAITATGNISGVDLKAARGDGTGVIYLNSASDRYVHWNGSQYVMPGATLSVNGGTVWTSSTFDPNSKASLTGASFSGDITTYRSATPSTGVIFLGNSGSRYLYYDGSNYTMPGANLYVNGSLVYTTANLDLSSRLAVTNPATVSGNFGLTGTLVVGSGQTASYIQMVDTNEGTRQIHNNSGTIGFLASDGAWALRCYDGGAVWTRQFGDLNTRIEDRAYAWRTDAINHANGYTNQFISALRYVDGGYDEWNTMGNNMTPPTGWGVIREIGMAFGATTYAAGGAIYSTLQAHTPNSG